jgi:hypothetical protein
MELDVLAFAKVSTGNTLADENTEAPISTLTTYSLHASRALLEPWHHRRLGRLHVDTISHMANKGPLTRMEIKGSNTAMGPCNPCLKGKQTREEICKTMVTRADCALNHVSSDARELLATQTQNGHKHLVTFSDVRKLLATQTQNGHKNLVTFVDNHACEESIHRPCDKLQVEQALKALIFWAGPSTGQMVQVFHSNGSSKHMAGHLQEVPHHTAPLHDALPVYALDLSTPEDALNDNKPDIFRLRAFSCEAFMHTPGNVRGRHDARSLTSSTSLYRLTHQPSCIIESCNIVLNEGGPTHHHHHHHIIIIILNHDGAPATPAAPDGDCHRC